MNDSKPPSLSEIGAVIGVAKSRVHRLKTRGMPVDTVERAFEWYRENVRATARAASNRRTAHPSSANQTATADTSAESDGYQDARTRRERAVAEEAELRAGQTAGRLIDREKAERGAFVVFRALRDAAFAGCHSQAAQIVGVSDVRQAQSILEDGLRQVFEDVEAAIRTQLDGGARLTKGKR